MKKVFFTALAVMITYGFAEIKAVEDNKYTDFSIAAGASLNANIHNSQFNGLPGIENCCNEFKGAFGFAPRIFAGVEYKIGEELFGMKSRASLLLSYTDFSADFSEEEFIGNYISGDVIEKEIVEHSLKPSLKAFMTEIGFAAQPIESLPLSVGAGLKIGFLLDNSFEQKEILVSPDEAVFENGTDERNFHSGDIPNASNQYIGISLGLGWDAYSFGDFILRPQLEYTHTLTNISSLDWQVNYFSAGAALVYNIPMPVEPPPAPPAAAPLPSLPSAPKPVKVTLALKAEDASGILKEGDVIHYKYNAKEFYNEYSVLPVVFFDKNNAAIPWQDDFKPANQKHAQAFPVNAAVIYLNDKPAERITLTSYILDDEIPSAAQKRLDAVKQKLADNNISKDRINANTVDMTDKNFPYDALKDEYRAVNMSFSGSGGVISLERKTAEKIEKENHTIKVTPLVDTDAENIKFECSVFIDGDEVDNFDENGCLVNLENHINNFNSKKQLVIKGMVTAAAGQTVEKDIKLIVDPVKDRTEKIYLDDESKNNLFILGFFAFDEHNFLSVNKNVVEIITQALESQRQVTFIPLHDTFGTAGHNDILLRRRAESALNLFPKNKDLIEVKFPDKFYFPNDSPSSRVLNRSVLVFIK